MSCAQELETSKAHRRTEWPGRGFGRFSLSAQLLSAVFVWTSSLPCLAFAGQPSIHVERGHVAEVVRTAIDASDIVLASADASGEIRAWDIDSGAEFAAFSAGGEPTALALSADAKLLGAAIKQRSIVVWNARTNEVVAELPTPGQVIRELQIDGAALRVYAATGQALMSWDLSDRKALYTKTYQGVEGFSLSPKGDLVAVASGKVIFALKSGTGEQVGNVERFLEGGRKHASGVAWNADDTLVFEDFERDFTPARVTGSTVERQSNKGCLLQVSDPERGNKKNPLDMMRGFGSDVRIFSTSVQGAVVAVRATTGAAEGWLMLASLAKCRTLKEVRTYAPSLRDEPAIGSVFVSPSGKLAAYGNGIRVGLLHIASELQQQSVKADVDQPDQAFSVDYRPVSGLQMASDGTSLYVNHSVGRHSRIDLSGTGFTGLRVEVSSTDGSATGLTEIAGLRMRGSSPELMVLKGREAPFLSLRNLFNTFPLDGLLERYRLPVGDKIASCKFDASPIARFTRPQFSEDGSRLLVVGRKFSGDRNFAIAFDVDSCHLRWRVEFDGEVNRVAIANNGESAVFSFADGSIQAAREGQVRVVAASVVGESAGSVAVSPDGRVAFAGRRSGELISADLAAGGPGRPTRFRASKPISSLSILDGALLVGTEGGTVHELRVEGAQLANEGRSVLTLEGADAPVLAAFDSNTPRLRFAVLPGGAIVVWRRDGPAKLPIGILREAADGRWSFATPDGWFDTNALDSPRGLAFASSDWLGAIPIEALYRTRFEPNLLVKRISAPVAAQELSGLPSNLLQPRVKEIAVTFDAAAAAGGKSLARVRVVVEETRRGAIRSGVNDLRLFVDGRLVARSPKTVASQAESPEQWKRRTNLLANSDDREATIEFEGVEVSRRAGNRRIEVSAYAFNDSQVKGPTKIVEVRRGDTPPVPGRAYVVSFGANSFESKGLHALSYAVDDATALADALRAKLTDLKRADGARTFSQVSAVTLTSKEVAGGTATKASLRDALAALAGREPRPSLVGVKDGAVLERLKPEDTLILAISTHGLATPDGGFYLMPSDSGSSASGDPLLDRAISAAELSEWINELPAAEIVLLIDACNSAGVLQDGTFRATPAARQGLGQLAFDKGMRVLAASQRAQYSVESKQTKHGLLTYVIDKSLNQKSLLTTLPDGGLSISPWLRYVESAVPKVHEELRAGGEMALVVKSFDPATTTFKAAFIGGEPVNPIQRPVLFDYAPVKRVTGE